MNENIFNFEYYKSDTVIEKDMHAYSDHKKIALSSNAH